MYLQVRGILFHRTNFKCNSCMYLKVKGILFHRTNVKCNNCMYLQVRGILFDRTMLSVTIACILWKRVYYFIEHFLVY